MNNKVALSGTSANGTAFKNHVPQEGLSEEIPGLESDTELEKSSEPEEEKIGGLIQLLTDLTTRIADAGLITDAQSGTA